MTRPKLRFWLVIVAGLVLLVCFLLFSASASRNTGSTPRQQNQSPGAKARQEHESRFPVTDYDSPEPANSEEKVKRKLRNKHYDGKGLVQPNPSSDGDISTISEAFLNLPAMPIAQSAVVLTGTVMNSEAHLSNDKFAVYSEFNIQVETVLKGTLSQPDAISVSRFGGKVRYPSGRQVLYSIAQQSMPTVGRKYLFFLKGTEDPQVFEVLRGYDITSEFLIPLDYTSGDEAFRKKLSTAFLATVREAIGNQPLN